MKSIGILKPPSLVTIKDLANDRFLTKDANMSVGEVYTAEIDKEQPSNALANFFRVLVNSGYAMRESQLFASLSLTYCKGSVQPHDDEGFGLSALWLVSVKPLHKNQREFYPEKPLLYSSKQWLDVRLGEIIVFDTNNEHAWLSNYHCSMIMQTVRKARRTRRVESN